MAGRPGRKPKKSLEEQIEQVVNDIEIYKESIKTLELKKEELLKQKREQDLSELYNIMTEMNMTVEDVRNVIDIKKENNDKQYLEVV